MEYFNFDGTSSLDLGLCISGEQTYAAPERDFDRVVIPGRNGDLIMDNGRYKAVIVRYRCLIREDFPNAYAAVRAFFLSHNGYFKLYDTYHPGEFRIAAYNGGLDNPETGAGNMWGQFRIEFLCRPERYLESGEIWEEIADGDTIHNPTLFPSRPLIEVTGSGSFTIGDQTVTLTNNSGSTTTIDSDLMVAYKDGVNMCPYMSGDFPVIDPGSNNVALSGVTMNVKGRWWTL